MHASTTPHVAPSPKPLSSLGRDEMNLAEFPISLLTDRVPKDQSTAIYQDEIHDERTGLTLTRKLTITAGGNGLTTAADDDVILTLIQLTREKNNFTNRRVEFSRHELVQRLGWTVGGASYDRLLLSLKRWTSVFLQYENAWRDNRTKTWTTAGFHIIDKFEITDTRSGGGQLELLPSYIVWGDDLFVSFQAGYLKSLDYDLCMGLRNSTAKRMYRFLDKRFYHGPDQTFELKLFAHAHIGLGDHYEGPSHLKRNLAPAIKELETIGFLEPLSPDQRFKKVGREWRIRLIKKIDTPALASPAKPAVASEPMPTPLMARLMERGVSDKSANELVESYPPSFIEAKIEQFDWEMAQPKPPKKPAGYLVKSIQDGYRADPDFVSAAERQRRADAIRAEKMKAAEDSSLQREAEARQKEAYRAITAYWESRTPEQQAEIQAEADALEDPASLARESGPLKKMAQQVRREQYIQQLLTIREEIGQSA